MTARRAPNRSRLTIIEVAFGRVLSRLIVRLIPAPFKSIPSFLASGDARRGITRNRTGTLAAGSLGPPDRSPDSFSGPRPAGNSSAGPPARIRPRPAPARFHLPPCDPKKRKKSLGFRIDRQNIAHNQVL